MPNLTHKFVPLAPSPSTFITCGHESPPTPRPPVKPVAGTRPTTANYSFRCLSCDISYRTASQSLVLDTYNGLIDDQQGRLFIAAERKGTEREGRYDQEMVAEGQRRIRTWEIKRATEIATIWQGFAERWDGGDYFENGMAKALRVKFKVDREGGYVVDGVPIWSLGV